jgi:hypothetical protein
LCGTISATVVLKIPTFPALAPERQRANIAHARLRERPNSRLEVIAQVMANSIIGFRPKRSEARPQGIAVQHWDIEKMADMIPAHFPTSLGGTPKDSIISGRYG